MVLSEAACPEGKDCKNAECIKSHVSPAVAHGGNAGPSRMLCKYQNCSNPACPYRHEDANGNAIPPPALTKTVAAPKSVDASSDAEEDLDVVITAKSLLNGPLDDNKKVVACRFGERCTRRKFIFKPLLTSSRLPILASRFAQAHQGWDEREQKVRTERQSWRVCTQYIV